MSGRKDLTRWNRAGLNRFEYVDGNAVEYLEILRGQLVRQFADPESGACEWLNPAEQVPAKEVGQAQETLVERQQRLSLRSQRLLETYHQDRRDWAWEITRSFARCCHMLTGHANTYANERFLDTATQWEHVRRLVEMLDYHPAPPASASTWLCFTAKQGMSGVIKRGFQVKNNPPAGRDKVIFETLEDLAIDADLNTLRPLGWDKSEQPLVPPADTAPGGPPSAPATEYVTTTWLPAGKPAVEPGETAMVMDASNGRAGAVTVNRVEEGDASPSLLSLDLLSSAVQEGWEQWPAGDVLLRYSSRWHKKSWLNGVNVVRTSAPHGLSVDIYLGWKEEADGLWRYAQVIETDTRNLRFDYAGRMPGPGTELFLLKPIEGDVVAANMEVVALLGDPAGTVDPKDAVLDVTASTGSALELKDIFEIKDMAELDFSLPLPLPTGSLPGIGSFLFPTPFLPIDLVKAAVELMLNLGVMQIPSTGEIVFKGVPLEGVLGGMEIPDAAARLFQILDELVIPDVAHPDDPKLVTWIADTPEQAIKDLEDLLESATKPDTPLFQELQEEFQNMHPMLALRRGETAVAEVIASDPAYMFDSQADRIQSGDWVVAEFSGGSMALKIDGVEKFIDEDKTETFAIDFLDLPAGPGELGYVHADFRGELVPHNAAFNESEIDPENFLLEHVPDQLKVGRQVLITGCGEPYLVKIVDIVGDRIVFEPELSPCQKGKLVIHGNVVLAGHGETQAQKIIGSGSAAMSNQSFTLDVKSVSFISDSSNSAGVAAAVEVEVAGRVWQQVSTLRDSAPDDHHYAIRMTEDGYVTILFGDGVNGRRLPSGRNNLRVHYRVGSGIAGNVAAGSLIKPVKPNPLVDSVAQALSASGGGDMEDRDSLRANAPPTVLALKRAVSLSDFSHLAASQSSIWQAQAYSELLHGGRMEKVTVIVVPAGGIFSADIKNELQNYLQKQSMPGVSVTVESFIPQLVDLNVTVRVDSSSFVPREIEVAVEDALLEQFALQHRGLGKPLYLSEVYKVVENIEGVENSTCVLNGDAGIRVVRVGDRRSVLHLDTESGSTLTVTSQEHQP